jgi:hypothetical protein
MAVNVDHLDLGELARRLARDFEESLPEGDVPGRTALREAIAAELECSSGEAEAIVDVMVEWGFLRFEVDRAGFGPGDGVWRISAAA